MEFGSTGVHRNFEGAQELGEFDSKDWRRSIDQWRGRQRTHPMELEDAGQGWEVRLHTVFDLEYSFNERYEIVDCVWRGYQYLRDKCRGRSNYVKAVWPQEFPEIDSSNKIRVSLNVWI